MDKTCLTATYKTTESARPYHSTQYHIERDEVYVPKLTFIIWVSIASQSRFGLGCFLHFGFDLITLRIQSFND